MRIHPEGVEVLKWFGVAAIVLLLFVLRFSNILPNIYEALLERAGTKFPARKPRRGHKIKLSYRTKVRQKVAFWILTASVLVFLLAEWFAIPEPYKINNSSLLPPLCAGYATGLLVIGLGPICDERGSRWRRWTFWVSTLATALAVFLVAKLINPTDPRDVFAVFMLSIIPFAWISSFMDYVDGALIEAERLSFKKDYDGTMPPVAMQSEHSARQRQSALPASPSGESHRSGS